MNKKATLLILLLIIGFLFAYISLNINSKNKTNESINVTLETEEIIEQTKEIIKETEEDAETIIEEIKVEEMYYDGYVGVNILNIRNKPSISSKIIGTLSFNEKIEYTNENEEWSKIKYNDKEAYVYTEYISDKETDYKDYSVPENRGFKSYMDYRCITSKSSPQYKLQNIYAINGVYGIRQVSSRFCVAIGSYFTTEIGQYFDLILENGTTIPCILSDQKADGDTDSNNISTLHNGCVSEFIVDTHSLNKTAKRNGDISFCSSEWSSPVVKIRVYNKNIFD